MPKNFISASASTRWGQNITAVTGNLCAAKGALEQLKADLDNMTDNTDWTVIEGNLGVPSGKGQTIYNLVAGAVSELQAATNLNNLINWLGAIR